VNYDGGRVASEAAAIQCGQREAGNYKTHPRTSEINSHAALKAVQNTRRGSRICHRFEVCARPAKQPDVEAPSVSMKDRSMKTVAISLVKYPEDPRRTSALNPLLPVRSDA
jgi:hypothetical protein